MADIEVMCITKAPRDDTHHGITNLGGNGWYWTRQQVTDSIKAGANTFYMLERGRRAELGVHPGPPKEYLRARTEGEWTDNLLVLPSCE